MLNRKQQSSLLARFFLSVNSRDSAQPANLCAAASLYNVLLLTYRMRWSMVKYHAKRARGTELNTYPLIPLTVSSPLFSHVVKEV